MTSYSTQSFRFALKLVLFTILMFFIHAFFVYSVSVAQDWKSYVKDFSVKLLQARSPGGTIFISPFQDESHNQRYYPFMKTVSHVMSMALQESGFSITKNSLSASFYIMPTFLQRTGTLFLNGSLIDAKDGTTLLNSATAAIPFSILPKDWQERKLEDIAFELVRKLESKFFAQKVKIIIREFSGGHSKKDAFVSEFSIKMMGFVKEEMTRFPGFTILIPSEQTIIDKSVYTLKGHYSVTNSEILFRLVLTKEKPTRKEIANVSSQFAAPKNVNLFPPNIQVAKQMADDEAEDDFYSTKVNVAVWTNKADNVYRNNDELIVYLRPEEDCYARVFYIQSDGQSYQLFPSNPRESDRLIKGKVIGIGSRTDDVRLVIRDETVGQEFIKIFTSKYPFEQSDLSKTYISGANVFHIPTGYRSIQRSLKTRGIDPQKRPLLPTAEVKIFVK